MTASRHPARGGRSRANRRGRRPGSPRSACGPRRGCGSAGSHPRAIVKEDVDQLIVPLPAGPDLADRLAVLLRELVPPSPPTALVADPDAAAVAAAEAVAAGFGPVAPLRI